MAYEKALATPFERAMQRLAQMAREDPQIAAAAPHPLVMQAIREPGLPYVEIVRRALTGYGPRPALGSRRCEIRIGADGRRHRHVLPAFDTISYADVLSRAEAAANAWRHDPDLAIAPGEFAAFIAFASADMVVADIACTLAQLVTVPLQANLPHEDLAEILRDTSPAVLIAAYGYLEVALDHALAQPSVRCLVVIDADPQDDDEHDRIAAAAARLDGAGRSVAVLTLGALAARRADHTWMPLPRQSEGPDALMMLMYTSGSTGTPKGAMVHEAMCSELWTAAPPIPAIQLAYAPLNHFMGRNTVFSTLAQGGTVYFTHRSDMSTLFEDIRLVRPTSLGFMPRVAEIVYQHYLGEVQRRIAAGFPPDKADTAVRAEMRATFLGDRLVAGGIGSAPTAPAVQDFLRDCFDIAFSEGYSSTEGSSTAMIAGGRVQRGVVLDYKLIDVPELGYLTSDRPHPRGELLLKSRLAIKGYFKRPEATAAIFDSEGWLHTGDIMEERGPDQLIWVDRRNNVIKLAQAEYVAVSQLEAKILGHSRLIRQVFVHGSSYRAFLLAVVVPDVVVAAGMLGHAPSQEELRELVLADLHAVARAAALKSFELPRDVLIETEPFTHENGLLSSVRKPLRPKLKARYGEALEALYRTIEDRQQAERASLRDNAALSPVQRVAGAMQAALGLAELDPHTERSFADLGGDSLGAVGFAMMLGDIFGMDLPVSLVLGPTASPARIAQAIARLQGNEAVTFTQVHGDNPTVLRASDLTLEAFLDPAFLARAAGTAPPTADVRHVLLTGATGFLGRFLLVEWLERAAQKGGAVTCLVRAGNPAQARERLDQAIGDKDEAFAARWRQLAEGHLRIVTGDLAAPRLGLATSDFDRLAEIVDHIVHPGALVNHLLPYPALFAPNVAGTAELIRLALATQQKPIDYVSTFGVPQMHPGLAQAPESADVRLAAPEMPLHQGYAAGYGLSKWASEVLLRDAHARFGLPVTVYRPDMILPPLRARGQVNAPDMFIRLLFSLIASGLAPDSFYGPAPDGSRARVHYDGIPVDLLAAALCRIGASQQAGFRTFNTISSHLDDGVSLDTITDWAISAGYPIARIADHGDWLLHFAARLRQLPEDQRQHSALPLLDHFARPHPAAPLRVPNGDFVNALSALSPPAEVPHLSEAFIHKCLNDMRLAGLIGAPDATGEAAA